MKMGMGLMESSFFHQSILEGFMLTTRLLRIGCSSFFALLLVFVAGRVLADCGLPSVATPIWTRIPAIPIAFTTPVTGTPTPVPPSVYTQIVSSTEWVLNPDHLLLHIGNPYNTNPPCYVVSPTIECTHNNILGLHRAYFAPITGTDRTRLQSWTIYTVTGRVQCTTKAVGTGTQTGGCADTDAVRTWELCMFSYPYEPVALRSCVNPRDPAVSGVVISNRVGIHDIVSYTAVFSATGPNGLSNNFHPTMGLRLSIDWPYYTNNYIDRLVFKVSGYTQVVTITNPSPTPTPTPAPSGCPTYASQYGGGGVYSVAPNAFNNDPVYSIKPNRVVTISWYDAGLNWLQIPANISYTLTVTQAQVGINIQAFEPFAVVVCLASQVSPPSSSCNNAPPIWINPTLSITTGSCYDIVPQMTVDIPPLPFWSISGTVGIVGVRICTKIVVLEGYKLMGFEMSAFLSLFMAAISISIVMSFFGGGQR